MPLVRISLSASHSDQRKNALSKAVHQALIDEFKIPEDDYFHIIEVLGKSQIKYPQEYLGIPHTDDIIFIQIIAAVGRTIDQKRNLYRSIATLVEARTKISSKDIIITLLENQKENWSFGNGELQTFNHV
ncbi:tautomerase family protein [Rapidithrix thailandica]|uniref:Tautomerase family protein n=1 Tax=Rapidithrix thailandica TaxID=413964 RepID=A0AAW9S6Y4_9BACT